LTLMQMEKEDVHTRFTRQGILLHVAFVTIF
jgi:hypothetical protein